MKRIAFLAFIILGLSACAWSQAQETSLGDAARKNRKEASSRKVWTNDDFQSTAASPAPTTASQPADNAAPAPTNDASAKDASKEDPTEKQKAIDSEWGGKITQQKERVADLERELNLLEREYRLKAATYYADAGNRLRDPKGWADTEQAFQDKNRTLKEQIASEKTKLDEMQEEARKAGVTSSSRE